MPPLLRPATALVLLSTLLGATQATRPTSQPSASTPLEALRTYNKAMYAGDHETMLSLQHTTNDEEKRLARANARSDAGVAELVKAAVARFGVTAHDQVSKAIGDIREQDVKSTRIEGDKAILLDAGDEPLLHMVNVDGVWKLDLPGVTNGDATLTRLQADASLRNLNFVKVLRQDVDAGRFKTLDELTKRIETRDE